MTFPRWTPWALLAATNAAWVVALLVGHGPEEGSDPERSSTGREIAELRRENEELRRAAPATPALATTPSPTAAPVARTETTETPAPPARAPEPDAVATAARAKSEAWTADIHQIQDLRKREAAVEAVRAALSSAEASDRLGALWTIQGTHGVAYDREALRPSVLALLDAERADERAAAFAVLPETKSDPSDLARLLEHADDPEPEMQAAFVRLLVWYARGDLAGRPEALLLSRLADADPKARREVLRSIGGAPLTPALEARILEIARGDSASAADATYFVISGSSKKSAAMVAFLVEQAEKPGEPGRRAVWGLAQGVPPELGNRVATFALKLSETRNDGQVRRDALRVVQRNGDSSLIPELERYLSLPGLDAHTRSEVEQIIGYLRRQKPR